MAFYLEPVLDLSLLPLNSIAFNKKSICTLKKQEVDMDRLGCQCPSSHGQVLCDFVFPSEFYVSGYICSYLGGKMKTNICLESGTL